MELVPPEARDQDDPQLVHWAAPAGSSDPFTAGAYWALSYSLSLIFGNLLGDLINEATVSNVQRWDGSGWVPLA